MALLGVFVAVRFTEDNFTRAHGQRRSAALSIFRRGVWLARRDREILLVLTAAMIINGAGMVSWLFPRQLVDLGFPADPVLWYTAIGTASFAAGAVALRLVERGIDRTATARRTYALACCAGAAGLILLTRAPNAIVGGLGVVLVSGVAFNVSRAVSVIWVNRRSTSDVRATMHSFLSQAETVGEIAGGAGLAVLARTSGISLTLTTSAGLIAFVAAMVAALAPYVGCQESRGTPFNSDRRDQ